MSATEDENMLLKAYQEVKAERDALEKVLVRLRSGLVAFQGGEHWRWLQPGLYRGRAFTEIDPAIVEVLNDYYAQDSEDRWDYIEELFNDAGR